MSDHVSIPDDFAACPPADGPDPAPCPDCGGEMHYPATDEPYCEWCDGEDDMIAAMQRAGMTDRDQAETMLFVDRLRRNGQRAAAIAVMSALVESLKETK